MAHTLVNGVEAAGPKESDPPVPKPTDQDFTAAGREVEVVRVPVVEERLHVEKREREMERVRVRTGVETFDATVRETLAVEEVDVRRVPVEREVGTAPEVRREGDITIVPVLEERLVVEKKLFVVEELHIVHRAAREDVSVPVTLRRTRVEVDREKL